MNKHINHYHVSVVSSEISFEPLTVHSEVDAIVEYDKRVQTMIDLRGMVIEKRGINVITFTNGDTVKWRVCRGDCESTVMGEPQSKPTKWPRHKKETEYIF